MKELRTEDYTGFYLDENSRKASLQRWKAGGPLPGAGGGSSWAAGAPGNDATQPRNGSYRWMDNALN